MPERIIDKFGPLASPDLDELAGRVRSPESSNAIGRDGLRAQKMLGGEVSF